jgi:hypothetical protein
MPLGFWVLVNRLSREFSRVMCLFAVSGVGAGEREHSAARGSGWFQTSLRQRRRRLRINMTGPA